MKETTSIGELEFSGNEQKIDSSIEDPPKLRQGSRWGSALGCLSGDRLVENGRRLEKTLIIFKEPDDGIGGGRFEFFAQLPGTEGDAGMIRLLTLDTTGAYFHVPVFESGAPQPPNPTPPPSPPPVPPTPPVDGTHGIPEGDFTAVRQYYGFPSDDQQPYLEGRLTWLQVIQRMDRRR